LYAAPKNTGIETMDDLKEYGQNNKILFGSPGKGKPLYESQKQLFEMMGVEYNTITYENGYKGILNLLGDSTTVLATSTTVASDYLKTGDLVALSMLSPDDFTTEDGVVVKSISSFDNNYDFNNDMLGLFATRAGTDTEIVQYLNDSLRSVFENEEYINEIESIQNTINWKILDSNETATFLDNYSKTIGSVTKIQ